MVNPAPEPKKISPIREVETLPEVAVLNEIVRNKADGFLYMGMEFKEGVKENGSSLEKTSVCN